jgi:glycosyltransferase involved in cell wall biosynthesis
MHVVHCLSRSDVGGGQQLVWSLVHGFRTEFPDVRTTVVLPPGGVYVSRFKELGIGTIELPFDRLSPALFAPAAKLLRSLTPDVIHSHGKGAGMYARAGVGRTRSIRRVHMFHGFHPPASPLGSRLYLGLERYLSRITDAFVAVSPGEAELIGQSIPDASRLVHCIPNTVDRETVRIRSEEPIEEGVGQFISSRPGSALITMIARRDPVKNHPLAFDAIRYVFERETSSVVVFVGIDGTDEGFARLTGDFPGRVLAVERLANPMPVLKASRCALLTSRREGSPLSLLEAACLGIPVVATDVPGIRDVVVPGVTGVLCEETSKSIGEGILRVLKDDTTFSSVSEKALGSGRILTMKEWVGKYHHLYCGG